MKLRDAKLRKLKVNEKNSFTHTPSCILPSFSQNTSRLDALKVCEHNFFREI